MKHLLINLISQALQSLGISEKNISLEIPEKQEFGDFSCNIAMQLAKKMGKSPRILAQEIIDALPENNIIEKTDIAGPGFINFFVQDTFVVQNFLAFSPENPLHPEKSKKICIDSSHPNIAKPLHFGHLRSTVIGDSLAKILTHCGHQVLKDSFLGDWGTGFGKLVVAIEKWGDLEKIKKNPIEELVTLYRKFTEEAKENPTLEDEGREAFRKLEMENDEKIKEKWEWIRSVSLEELQKFYDSIGVSFDRTQGESFYVPLGEKTLEKIETIGEISEGALVVKFLNEEKEEQMPLILFRRADGATLYQTRDVSRILWYEKEEHYDELIYVVSHEQSLHFRQIFETAKKLGSHITCEHVSFGLVLGTDGKKFSTRKGNGVGLDEVFDEAKEKVAGIISERVDTFSNEEKQTLIAQIAIGAIKFNDLSQNRNTDIVFDWEKMLCFEGFSGPFLQYSHARAKSLLQKNEIYSSIPMQGWSETELPLIKKILEFSDIVFQAGETKRPNILAEYLFQLAKQFNGFYQNTPILKAETEEAKQCRIYLVHIFANTLKKGLELLGIEAPEKM